MGYCVVRMLVRVCTAFIQPPFFTPVRVADLAVGKVYASRRAGTKHFTHAAGSQELFNLVRSYLSARSASRCGIRVSHTCLCGLVPGPIFHGILSQ